MPDKLAQYELLTPLGAGGMGEVYRAKDTRLDREVAVKILPEALAKDPERIARFDREAKTLASLTHPNIATVHDFMTVDGTSFLVMELVEGEDLSERLEKGAIDPEDARQLAIQIAAGLEAAHERGIVHRDLKPANVRITPDGQVKILDFGLARAVTGDPEDASDPMLSPTITQAMTQAGTILGTAAYMSPEQARGKHVDKRADIWAFGVLLYEMLTGERLFEGETTSDTLASVLRTRRLDQLDDSVSHDVLWVLQRCLDRNPTRRLRDIGEARLVLVGESTVSQMGIPRRRTPGTEAILLWPAISLLLAVALAALFFLRPAPEPSSSGFPSRLPEEVSVVLGARQPGPAAIAPDASAVVFSGQGPDGDIYLWYRRLDSPTAQRLDATIGASYPFWSPDSRLGGFLPREQPLADRRTRGQPLAPRGRILRQGWDRGTRKASSCSRPPTPAGSRGSRRAGGHSESGDRVRFGRRRQFPSPPLLPPGRSPLPLPGAGGAGFVRIRRELGACRIPGWRDGALRRRCGRTCRVPRWPARLRARRGAGRPAIRSRRTSRCRVTPGYPARSRVSWCAAARTAASVSAARECSSTRSPSSTPRAIGSRSSTATASRSGRRRARVISKVVVSPDRNRAAVVHGGRLRSESSIWIWTWSGVRVPIRSGSRRREPVPGVVPGREWLAYGRRLGRGQRAGVPAAGRRRRQPDPAPRGRDPGLPESWSPSGRRITSPCSSRHLDDRTR